MSLWCCFSNCVGEVSLESYSCGKFNMQERVLNAPMVECFAFLQMAKIMFYVSRCIVLLLLLLCSNSENVYQTGLKSPWWPSDMLNFALQFGGHV